MLIPVSSGWSKLLSVIYVMVAQAISGIAKDLNKMSAKSAIKIVVSDSSEEDGGIILMGSHLNWFPKCTQRSWLLSWWTVANQFWF